MLLQWLGSAELLPVPLQQSLLRRGSGLSRWLVEPQLIFIAVIYYYYFAELVTEEVGIPRDITLIKSSTTSLTLGWIVNQKITA